jgi:hypothetical protein
MTDFQHDAQGPFDSGPSDPFEPSRSPGVTNLSYGPSEALFGSVCNNVLANGWTMFPQERVGRRLPSRIDGETLKWGEWIEKMPTAETVRRWGEQARMANGAVILGPPSNNTWVIDIDVMDPHLSISVQEIADEVFGRTRFRRQGQAPKMALFYRAETEDQLPPYRRFQFLNENGSGASDDAIEILGRGRAITVVGYHHKTSEYFKWAGRSPMTHRSDVVPVATLEQLETFIDRIQKLRAFAGSIKKPGARIIDGSGEIESLDGWNIPPTRTGGIVVDGGLIANGREGWLKDLCFDFVRYNPERCNESPATALEVLVRYAASKLEMKRPIGGKDLRSATDERLARAINMLRAGEIEKFPTLKRTAEGRIARTQRGVIETKADPALWHLPTADKRRALDIDSTTKPDADKAAERALRTDRSHVDALVAAKVDQAFGAFFDEAYDPTPHAKTVHVLRAPTGGGKTTRAIRYIALDERTKDAGFVNPGGSQPGPILFLLPTYNNISEVRQRADVLNLDPNLSDEDLAAAALDAGLVSEEAQAEEIERLRGRAENAGLRTLVYKGKIPAGCKIPDRVQALMDAGISTSGLCHARVFNKSSQQFEDEFCPHYSTCPAVAQKALVAEQHIVFLPHAFLNLTIPEELKNARAVIADERIFTLSVHTSMFQAKHLDTDRREPRLTKKERELGVTEIQLQQERRRAGTIVLDAFKEGRDPAATLAAYVDNSGAEPVTGLTLVKSAARVCGSASSTNVAVHPSMSDAVFRDIVTMPTGEEVGLEYRFWRIVEARIEKLLAGENRRADDPCVQLRMQAMDDGTVLPMVRISWMSEPNWPSAPLLLLDASANERIVGRVFPDRKVVEHNIDVDLNLRVVLVGDRRWSTSSLVPRQKASFTERAEAARNMDLMRKVETSLALGRHADGRMLTSMAKSARALHGKDYLPPTNCDYLHYGAERGLNFAETHTAALVVGRMELPTWVLDGQAAALAGDDPDFVLLDPLGTGLDAEGNQLKPTTGTLAIPMRDGRDVEMTTAMAPEGSWQRIVQIQHREESLRQTIGRLRPVYRTDTPTAYVMSQVLPEGLIVDDIVSALDLVPSHWPLLEAARSSGSFIALNPAVSLRPDLLTQETFIALQSALPDELRANYHSVRYVTSNGPRFAGVPVSIDNPVAHLVTELAAIGTPAIEEPLILTLAANARVAPAAERPLDAVETELGDRDARRHAETAARAQAVAWLDKRHAVTPTESPYLAGAGMYRAGVDGKGAAVLMTLTALALAIAEKPEATITPQPTEEDEHEQMWAALANSRPC